MVREVLKIYEHKRTLTNINKQVITLKNKVLQTLMNFTPKINLFVFTIFCQENCQEYFVNYE